MGIIDSIRMLFKESAIYGVAGVLSRFIAIFLIPLYTSVLTPADYGIMGLLMSGYTLLSIFLVLNLDSATARWFYDSDIFAERKKTINSWVWFYQFLSLFACIILLLTSTRISLLWFSTPVYSLLIRIIALTIPLISWSNVVLNILRLERKPHQALLFSLTQSFLLIGFNCLFVLYLRWSLKGIYLSQLLSAVLTGAYAVVLLRKWIAVQAIDLKRLKEMLKYGLPFVPASIAGWLIGLSGLYFLNDYCSAAEVGVYQIGVSVATGVALFTNAFQMAWGPFSFSIIQNKQAGEIYSKVNSIYIVIGGFLCMGIGLFAPELLKIFTNEQYYGAAWVIAILAYNHIFIGLTQIAGTGMAIAKKTGYWGMIYIVSALFLIALNFLLIPWWGKEGAAVASCLSQLIVPVLLFYKSQKLHYIPYEFAKPVLVFFVLLGIMVVGRISILGHSLYGLLLFKFFLVLCAVGLVILVFKKDMKTIVQRVRSR